MRAGLLLVVTVLVYNFGFADSRKLTCDAVDSFDRTSQVEFDVDTEVLRMKDAAAASCTPSKAGVF